MNRYLDQIISYFFKHDVSDDVKEKVHHYLLAQRNAQDANDELKRIWDSLDNANVDSKASRDAYSYVEARLFGHQTKVRTHSRRRIVAIWLFPVLMLAASCYLFCVLWEQRNAIASVELCSRCIAYGERDSLVLADGTKVWLNSGSTIVYPSDFLHATRKVTLVGEAFFEVQKDKKPFVVDVGGMAVEVLGTTFNVSAYPSNAHVTATLETGVIQATIANKAGHYLLNPSDQLVYNRETGSIDIIHVDAGTFSSWRNGTLSINDISFQEISSMLERIYNVKIHILNEAYNNQILHAEFKYEDDIVDVMDVIKILIPGLSYTKAGQDIYVK